MDASAESASGEPRGLRVFLCHSSGDKPVVRDLYQRLRAQHFDPWLDEEKLLPGQRWDREITKAVKSSDAVIVCLSKSSVDKRGYVQREIAFALNVAQELPEDEIFVIPVRLEECDVPERLSHLQYVDLFKDGSLDRLVSSLTLRASALGIAQSIISDRDSSRSALELASPSAKMTVYDTITRVQSDIKPNQTRSYTKFSILCIGAIEKSAEAAALLKEVRVDPDHLLFGVLAMHPCVGTVALESMGVSPEKLMNELLASAKRGKHTNPPKQKLLSADTKRVIELSVDEAQHRQRRILGTQDLLVGVIIHDVGSSVEELRNRSITIDSLRSAINKVLSLLNVSEG